MSATNLLIDSFKAALAAANPQQIMLPHIPSPPEGKTIVIGAGKAAASMAHVIEDQWPHDKPLEGLVATRYGHSLPSGRIQIEEAAHPVPDDQCERIAKKILTYAQSAAVDDLLLVLLSGGGSSLLSLPAGNITIPDLHSITVAMLKSGMPIQEINIVRKHISSILGGQLAAATKASILCLIISDVPGEDPTHIASGPCAPDPTTFADAVEILKQYGIDPPISVKTYLTNGLMGEVAETPKPGDPIFSRVENRVIANAHMSLATAAAYFQQRGITPILLGDSVTGEAREVAKVYGALARQIKKYSHPFKPPVALISGGETTVTVRGNGLGGRCSEFLLSLAIDLNKLDNVYALAADTDGIDGSEDNAGAFITPDTLERANQLGISAKPFLANNNSYSFFASLHNLVITGPTYTNVNDYRVILIL